MPLKILKTSDMRGSKHKNTPKENRLEELGRVDAEKADSKKGKKNLKEEKSRIKDELNKGESGWITKKQKQNWITKKEAEDHDTTPKRKWISKKKKNWITKKEKPKSWITKKNTSRMNELEELGRVDAERGRYPQGRKNLHDEKRRIIREIKDPRAKRAGGGMAQRGLGRAFMKGGKV